tara:strand:- start:248 stop:727 length:480 start_codon:yes stop_codon:yes gene_type:complete
VIVLGVDPGPTSCGIALYCSDRGKVLSARKDITVESLLLVLSDPVVCDVVALERVQSYGIAGATLLQTSEVVGRIWQAAKLGGYPVELYYRREVLRALDVTGKGNRDSLVRQRLIEMHGGDRVSAVGTKKQPGPLYGVASHAWQALAVALAHTMKEEKP